MKTQILMLVAAALICGCQPEKPKAARWEYKTMVVFDDVTRHPSEPYSKNTAKFFDLDVAKELKDRAMADQYGGSDWEMCGCFLQKDGEHLVLVFKRPTY